MNIIIYHQQQKIYLTDEVDFILKDCPVIAADSIRWEDFHNSNATTTIFYNVDVQLLFNQFSTLFEQITAAGGVVINDENKMLWILRRGKWDLPKGKWDDGETIEECALREVEEETGVSSLHIVKELYTSYHTYNTYGSWTLKKTVWFLMQTSSQNVPIPQVEEDIKAVEWVSVANTTAQLSNTYSLIIDVLEQL